MPRSLGGAVFSSDGLSPNVDLEDLGRLSTPLAIVSQEDSACSDEGGVEGGVSSSSDDGESAHEDVSEMREGVHDGVHEDPFQLDEMKRVGPCRVGRIAWG